MKLDPHHTYLDGNAIESMAHFYDEIAKKLQLPDHFGRNLDALWDCLINDVEAPVRIVWQNSEVSAKAIGPKFAQLRKLLLEDLPMRRADVVFILR